MTWTRPAFKGLIWLFLLLLVIQFFLAGLGIAELGGKTDSLDTHKMLGQFMALVPFLMIIVALVGKLGGKIMGMSVTLLVLVLLQSLWAQADASWLRAIHPVGALLIVALAMHLATPTREADSAT